MALVERKKNPFLSSFGTGWPGTSFCLYREGAGQRSPLAPGAASSPSGRTVRCGLTSEDSSSLPGFAPEVLEPEALEPWPAVLALRPFRAAAASALADDEGAIDEYAATILPELWGWALARDDEPHRVELFLPARKEKRGSRGGDESDDEYVESEEPREEEDEDPDDDEKDARRPRARPPRRSEGLRLRFPLTLRAFRPASRLPLVSFSRTLQSRHTNFDYSRETNR